MSQLYLFPYEKVSLGSRVIIYGAGLVGMDYINQIEANNYCEIVGVAAKSFDAVPRAYLEEYNCIAPESITDYSFDYVVIATANNVFSGEMINILNGLGVDKNTIIEGVNLINVKSEVDSYSQHGEDKIIVNALKHMGYFRDGRLPSYIDVGAHHPYSISNTALLHSMGCRGVNIEANPNLIEAFYVERPDDINICVGVGGKEGEFPFYVSDIDGLNTFKESSLKYNEWLYEHDTGIKENYDVKQVITLPVKTLKSIIDEYCDGIWPDFMSMDIEGMERETLIDCDLSNGPSIIALEVNYDGDIFVEMMAEKGYFPYLWYRENILFVRNDLEKYVHEHEER